MPVDLSLGGVLLLHLLEPVSMTQQLEVLPRGEEQHDDEEHADECRAPHLAVPLAIDLADDRVVADVFLDRVFEGLRRHVRTACCSLPSARSFALRARGFRSTSASVGTTGRFVRMPIAPDACNARSVCFTMRSSRE